MHAHSRAYGEVGLQRSRGSAKDEALAIITQCAPTAAAAAAAAATTTTARHEACPSQLAMMRISGTRWTTNGLAAT